MLIKIILNELAFKNAKRLARNSFLWKFVPFSYCPGKKRKSKNIFMSFRYNKLKIMASPSPPFSGSLKVIGQFSRRDHRFCSGSSSPRLFEGLHGVELMTIFTISCEMITENRDR